jgi:hypothetical protein
VHPVASVQASTLNMEAAGDTRLHRVTHQLVHGCLWLAIGLRSETNACVNSRPVRLYTSPKRIRTDESPIPSPEMPCYGQDSLLLADYGGQGQI